MHKNIGFKINNLKKNKNYSVTIQIPETFNKQMKKTKNLAQKKNTHTHTFKKEEKKTAKI